jgi:hypothetical protein
VDEQEHSAGPEPSQAPASGATSPPTMPAAGQPGRSRGQAVGKALTSRAAGWVVAAVLLGAVVALSVVQATAPAPSVVAVLGPLHTMGSVMFGPGEPPGQVQRRIVGPVPTGPGWMAVTGPGGASWVAVPPGQIRMSIRPGGKIVSEVVPFGIPAGKVLGPGKFTGQFMSPFGQVVAGVVGSVSSSSFTVTVGVKTVTVAEQSSTVYRKAGNLATASAVTRGARVAVLGSQAGSKITAIVVAVLPG